MTQQNGFGDLSMAQRASGSSSMLASDSDRDAAAGLLGEAFAAGRLTTAEHAERLQAVYGARTWAELATLTGDLPTAPAAGAASPALISAGLDPCLLCALLILCPPAGIAWLLAARRRARAAGIVYAEAC